MPFLPLHLQVVVMGEAVHFTPFGGGRDRAVCASIKEQITDLEEDPEVGQEAVTIDANHPLAGQMLTFDIELVDVQQ